jgi:hypothetical protein
VIGGVSGYDPYNKLYWVEMSTNTSIIYFGINVTNGNVTWNVNAYTALETLAWDPATKLMYGFGLNSNFTYRTLVTLNSKTGEFQQVGKINFKLKI